MADYCARCKYWSGDPKVCPHECCYHHSEYLTAGMKAFVLIKKTVVAGRSKNRWECPHCRASSQSECRFNLDRSTVNIPWKCPHCKKESMLKVKP